MLVVWAIRIQRARGLSKRYLPKQHANDNDSAPPRCNPIACMPRFESETASRMNYSLEGLGATIAVGSLFLVGLLLIVRNDGRRAPWSVLRSRFVTDRRAFVILVFTSMSFMTGAFLEDSSEFAADNSPSKSWLLPSKRVARTEQFFAGRGIAKTYLKRGLLDAIEGVANQQQLEALVNDIQSAVDDPDGEFTGMKSLQQKSALHAAAVTQLYFVAKNAVYLVEPYYKDLIRIRSRIEFFRSTCFASFILLSLAIVTTSIRGMISVCKRRRGATRVFYWRWQLSATFAIIYAVAWSAYLMEEQAYSRYVFGYYISLSQGSP